jgi:hypothetical protein
LLPPVSGKNLLDWPVSRLKARLAERPKWHTANGFKASFPLQPYRIVTYRSIFFCVEVISSTQPPRKQRNTLRFGTIRLKWKTGLTKHCLASVLQIVVNWWLSE